MSFWKKVFGTGGKAELPPSASSPHREGEASLAEGERCMKDNNYEQAVKAFGEAVTHAPQLLKAYVGLAHAHEMLQQYDDMRLCCEAAVRQHPDSSRAYNLLGVAYDYLGNCPKALDHFIKAINLNPGDADSYAMIGRMLLDQGDYSEALAPLKKAIALEPDHAEAEFKLANAYYNLNDYETAIAHYNSYCKKYPFPWALFNLGAAYYQSGREAEAVELFRSAAAKGHKQATELLAQLGYEPSTEAERIAASLGLQYYDLRSEEYKKLERQAERELGPEDEMVARQLVSISQAYDQAAVRSVGEKLNSDGGLTRMKTVCLRAGTLGADTRWIEVYWSGVGDWLG